MRKSTHILRLFCALFLTGLAWFASTRLAHGQFTQNRDTIKIGPSSFPADVQRDYAVFRKKCNECHGLDTSLKMSLSPAGWTAEVKRMQSMASSQLNDKQAAAIIAFLNYDEAHRKAENKTATQPSSSDP